MMEIILGLGSVLGKGLGLIQFFLVKPSQVTHLQQKWKFSKLFQHTHFQISLGGGYVEFFKYFNYVYQS